MFTLLLENRQYVCGSEGDDGVRRRVSRGGYPLPHSEFERDYLVLVLKLDFGELGKITILGKLAYRLEVPDCDGSPLQRRKVTVVWGELDIRNFLVHVDSENFVQLDQFMALQLLEKGIFPIFSLPDVESLLRTSDDVVV